MFDIVIRHGKIVDGSGNPWFYGDVAVENGRIVQVGRVDGPARAVLDADGLVVAPGFIDSHSHADFVCAAVPGYAADIVVFDPEEIEDTATYENPFQYPKGIHYLLVNGKLSVREGRLQGIYGTVLRRKG